MESEHMQPMELFFKRKAYFQAHAKPNMNFDEWSKLNGEVYRLSPVTVKERQEKFEHMSSLPEFAL
jgi:hypothetical protein